MDQALEVIAEDDLAAALTHVSAVAAEAAKQSIEESAALAGHSDPALLDAAAGAATKASYQAALLLAGGGEEDHAMAIKFRLFEQGRWPIGIAGNTLNLF